MQEAEKKRRTIIQALDLRIRDYLVPPAHICLLIRELDFIKGKSFPLSPMAKDPCDVQLFSNKPKKTKPGYQ